MGSKATWAAALVCLLMGCGSSESSGQDAERTVLRESGVTAGEDSADCRGPGRYRAAKEGSYRLCCPGLREVLYTGSTFADDGSKICVEQPMRIFACVQGRCGDGVCEPGESEACGCVADCPSARWGDIPTGEVDDGTHAPSDGGTTPG